MTPNEMTALGVTVHWDMFKEDPARPYIRNAIERGYMDGCALAAACKQFRGENLELPFDGRQAYLRALAHSLAASMNNTMGPHASAEVFANAAQLLMAMNQAGGGTTHGVMEMDSDTTTVYAVPDKKDAH